MNQYSIFIYNDKLNGYEKWEYKGDIETDNPKSEIVAQYYLHIPHSMQTMKDKIKVKSFDAKIHINDVWFKSMTIAFNGKGKEIVLAERIKQ